LQRHQQFSLPAQKLYRNRSRRIRPCSAVQDKLPHQPLPSLIIVAGTVAIAGTTTPAQRIVKQ
jgi:hypothetical protein